MTSYQRPVASMYGSTEYQTPAEGGLDQSATLARRIAGDIDDEKLNEILHVSPKYRDARGDINDESQIFKILPKEYSKKAVQDLTAKTALYLATETAMWNRIQNLKPDHKMYSWRGEDGMQHFLIQWTDNEPEVAKSLKDETLVRITRKGDPQVSLDFGKLRECLRFES